MTVLRWALLAVAVVFLCRTMVAVEGSRTFWRRWAVMAATLVACALLGWLS